MSNERSQRTKKKPKSDINKIVIFMDYYKDKWNPSKDRHFLDFFNEDVTVCLILAIILPQTLLGNQALLYKKAELKAICAANSNDFNFKIPVNSARRSAAIVAGMKPIFFLIMPSNKKCTSHHVKRHSNDG
jgi:hypothetical protein